MCMIQFYGYCEVYITVASNYVRIKKKTGPQVQI